MSVFQETSTVSNLSHGQIAALAAGVIAYLIWFFRMMGLREREFDGVDCKDQSTTRRDEQIISPNRIVDIR